MRTALPVVVAVTFLAAAIPLHADSSSTANAYHTWNPTAVVGQSTLYRSAEGLKAAFKINANATDADRVVTLWFIVVNNPEDCLTSPCGADDFFLNPEISWDFLYGGGVVTTDNKAELGGSLATGDTSGSGFIELGLPAAAVGVTNPDGAEVHLVIHSHGPAVSGTFLKDQISSFLGGCFVFLGDADGFALGPEDVPDEVGECSSVIFSIHQP